MKIKKIEAFPLVVPTKEKYQMSKGAHHGLRTLVVKLTTENGTVGFGEAHQGLPQYTYETLEGRYELVTTHLAPALIGEDIWKVEEIGVKMDAVRTGNNFAKCAVEMAVFDALGKVGGLPISTLLGGAIRQEIDIIGWIGIAEPQKMVEKAYKLVDEGYRTIKIKIGASSYVREDIMRVSKIREAVGEDIKLRVDANAGFSLPDALHFVKGIEGLNLEHFEQPVAGWNLEGMARIREVSSVPIMADESVHTPQDALRVLTYGAADKIKIKISKVGGFLKARKIIDVAESAGVPIVIGNGVDSSIEASAELHLASIFTSASVDTVGEMVGPTKLETDLVEESFNVTEGRVQVPIKPGLGITVKNDLLTKFRKS